MLGTLVDSRKKRKFMGNRQTIVNNEKDNIKGRREEEKKFLI